MLDIPFEKLNLSEYGEKAKQEIQTWKDRVTELTEQEDFRQHPVTIKLALEATKQIQAIDYILKDVEEITEQDRKALFKAKKVHQIYLSLFTRDGSDELELIRKQVNEELTS